MNSITPDASTGDPAFEVLTARLITECESLAAFAERIAMFSLNHTSTPNTYDNVLRQKNFIEVAWKGQKASGVLEATRTELRNLTEWYFRERAASIRNIRNVAKTQKTRVQTRREISSKR
jgi:hypothetical protein